MRALVTSYVAVSVVGAVHAVRRGSTARFAGVRLPGTPRTHALTIGSPLSAPPVLLIALVVAARQRRSDAINVLSGLFLIGIAGEADTWATVRRPSADPVRTVCAGLAAALPIAMLYRGCSDATPARRSPAARGTRRPW
jgi:hypothetical protein